MPCARRAQGASLGVRGVPSSRPRAPRVCRLSGHEVAVSKWLMLIIAVAETFVCLDKNTHAMVNGDHETRFLMRFWGGTLSSPRMRAEDIGTDVVEITNETVELSKLTKAVSSEPR